MKDLRTPSRIELLQGINAATTAHADDAPKLFVQVEGSPFALTTNWQKVFTTTAATRSLRLGVPPIPSAYDIEWVSVPTGSAAPVGGIGEGVLAGEDFLAGIPLGDIYCKSATSQTLIVKAA